PRSCAETLPSPDGLCRHCRRIRTAAGPRAVPDIREGRADPRVFSWPREAASEQGFHVLEHSLAHPVRIADDLAHHLAPGVDNVRFREFERAVLGVDLVLRIARGEEGDTGLGEEIA